MAINFIPNDPDATSVLAMRKVDPRANRPASRAGYTLAAAPPQAQHQPGTPGFLFWQCREAALWALEAWETVSGAPFKTWQSGPRIGLLPDQGEETNAFYDRSSLSFFHAQGDDDVLESGASTDVVAHEAGHGILDAMRPDFWDSMLFEVNSFHEAFGDCVAVLTALQDKESRVAVLGSLSKKNTVESVMESLARAIAEVHGAGQNAAEPRHAHNKFKHVLPESLPDFGGPGDGRGVLINEIHSFAQVFTGCFYDAIVNVFTAGASKTEAALLKAANLVGALLAEAAAQAPQRIRFFREVGRAMVVVDEQRNGGANRDAISNAFAAHDIALGASSLVAPLTSLAGAPPKLGAKPSIGASVKKDLLGRLGAAKGAKAAFHAVRLGAHRVGELVHNRPVALTGLSERLHGVVAMAPESVLVGGSGGRAAVLGAMPQADNTKVDVTNFVRTLLRKNAIAFGPPAQVKSLVAKAAVAKGAVRGAVKGAAMAPVTHAIKTVGSQRVLVRVRFACGHGGAAR